MYVKKKTEAPGNFAANSWIVCVGFSMIWERLQK